MSKPNPVGWFEIYVNDLSRAKAFYEAVLQTSLNELPNPTDDPLKMMSFPSEMNVYGAPGALVYMQGFEAGGNSTLVYFSSDDCAIEERRVEAAGGKVFKPKISIGQFGFISLCIDTEGNMFGLHSLK